MRNRLTGLVVIIFSIAASLLPSGCAQIGMPTGGPRDSVAPVLARASPEPYAVNVSANKIVLSFNEFIDASNFSNEMVVSPLLKYNPQITVGMRELTIRLRDTLQPNTTYNFRFGNAIKDVNEGNVLKDFSYTFSTGPYVDSLKLGGRVTLAESGGHDTTLLAMLYKNLSDSAIRKERPDYITRIHNDGSFEYNYLPPGDYKLYALKDGNNNKRYDSDFEVIGFLPGNRTVQPGTTEVFDMLASAAKVEQPAPARSSTPSSKEPAINFSFNPTPNAVDLTRPFILISDKPLTIFNPGGIVLTDTNYVRQTGYTLRQDSTLTRIEIVHSWVPEKKYNLIIDSSFAKDSTGLGPQKTDTLQLMARATESYGAVALYFTDLDQGKNPVIQFVQSNAVVRSEKITGREWKTALFEPGDYDIRILYDANNNGIWDAGNFSTLQQPETVVPVGKKLSVRRNWDNELTLTL